LENEIAFLSIAELGRRLRAGEFSSRELTEHFLERIQELDPSLHAFITISKERALAEAQHADELLAQGKDLGPLHGIPYAAKDNLATAGVRTTGNSASLREWVPTEDAAVIARLKAKGAILLGKLSMNELGFGGFPICLAARNPWNRETRAGGSSGGSGAAAAARLAPFTLGTDGGGSTRIPAALCGVAGLAPMPGLIDGSGELPPVVYGRTRRIGVLTRGSQDLTIVLQQLTDATVEPIEGRGLRLGRLACEEEITLHPDVGPAFEEALQTFTQELGCKVTDLPLKGFSRALEANWIFLAHQAAEHYKEAVEANPHFYTTSFRELVEQGSNLSPQELSAAQAFRDAFGALLLGLFRQVDALIMPTTPFLDIPIGEPEIWQPPISHAEGFFTAPFNLVPCPALSIPCGFSRYGTPIGLQLVAAPNREAVILGLARAFEQVTDWHERIPPLAYNEKE